MMSPEQRVFTTIRGICNTLFGSDAVYDYIPPEGTAYPFVRLGIQTKQNRRLHKRNLNGDTQLMLHFWHNNVRQRGTLTRMMGEAEGAIKAEYGDRAEEINIRVMEDDTTSVTLLHGVMDINIKRYKNNKELL